MGTVGLLLLLLGGTAPAADAPVTAGHVRYANDRIAAVVEFGERRSVAFRRLLETIEQSNVVVHLAEGRCGEGLGLGCTKLIAGGQERQLLIRVNARQTLVDVLGQVAHELQHAAEIASSVEVIDPKSLRQLYERIGFRSCDRVPRECWQTRAAQTTEREVVGEALAYRPPVHRAFFGDWTLDVEASVFGGLDVPKSAHRRHRDGGYGLISVAAETEDDSGRQRCATFVYRPDGTNYRISDGEAHAELSIAVTPVDPVRWTFAMEHAGEVLSRGRVTLDPRGAILTIEKRDTDAQGRTATTVEVWRKTKSPSTSLELRRNQSQ